MRTSLRFFFALALPAYSILAACGTDRESGSPVDTGLELTGVAQFCPSGDIGGAIAACRTIRDLPAIRREPKRAMPDGGRTRALGLLL